MTEITRAQVARVGVDLSKRTYQVHAVDQSGRVVLAKAMTPERFFAWCMLTRDTVFDPDHLPQAPAARGASTPQPAV